MKKQIWISLLTLLFSASVFALPASVNHVRKSYMNARMAIPNDLPFGRSLDCREFNVLTGVTTKLVGRFSNFDGLIQLAFTSGLVKEKLYSYKVSSKGRQELMYEELGITTMCNREVSCSRYDLNISIRTNARNDIILETSSSRAVGGPYEDEEYDQQPSSITENRMKSNYYILCPND